MLEGFGGEIHHKLALEDFDFELLHHGRRVGDEEKTEIRVVSG